MAHGYNPHKRLNLSTPLVDEFWEQQDPRTQSVLEWMRTAETWTLDNRQNLDGALLRLATKLEEAPVHRIQRSLRLLIRIMAYLSTPKAMRLIEWLEQRHGASSRPHRPGVPAPTRASVDLVEEMLQLAELQKERGLRSREGLRGTEGAAESAVLIDRLQTLKTVTLLKKIFSPGRLAHITRLLDEIHRAS